MYDAITSTDPDVVSKVEQLEAFLVSMPVIPLQVEPTTHRQLIPDYYLKGLQQIFPVGAMLKRLECMSYETFRIVQERAVVRHALNNIAMQLSRSVVKVCFLLWKGTAFRRFRRPWWGCVHGPKTKKMCYKQQRLNARSVTLTAGINAT